MSTLLDLDLDWLNLCNNHEGSGFLKNRTPVEAFDDLMDRTNPKAKITMSIEHHEAYNIWDAFIDEGRLTEPKHIIHVDEHHDLYNNCEYVDCANFMFHALNQWPKCKTTWVAANRIGNERYFYWGFHKSSIKERFKTTLKVPNNMNDINLISVTVSPDFIDRSILTGILKHIETNYADRIIGQFPTLRKKENNWIDETYPSNWIMRHVRRF